MTPNLPLTILLADDHMPVRQIIYGVVVGFNPLRADMAHNGQEALALLQQSIMDNKPYDIVLLDQNMPSVTGMELLSLLRASPLYDHSAVAMVTAEVDRAHVIAALRTGATSYIAKPFSTSDLTKKLLQLIAWVAEKRRGSAMHATAPSNDIGHPRLYGAS